MIGRIVKVISNDYTVKYDNEYIICKARGIFRKNNITPLAGDIVQINIQNKTIDKIEKRKNELIRPPVANIDNALIVISATNPEFNSNLLDKMIDIIEFNNIKPIICFTKLDLLENKDNIKTIISYYKKIGYDVFTNEEISKIKKIFTNKLTILTGQTGVGKSTLINKLDSSLNLNTNEISKALGRGKHTTRHIQLYNLCDGLVADTPGFSSLDFIDMTEEDIRDNFIEFEKYKEKCKYRNCMHINEDECEVKKMVSNNFILQSRYDNYKKFILKKRNR